MKCLRKPIYVLLFLNRSPENKGVVDDRGNRLAVVAGLAGPDKFEAIKKVLGTEFHASPYMEKYILESFFFNKEYTYYESL